MKVMKVVTLPAEGGRYHIFRNGVDTGIYHLQPHTASARITQMKIDEPNADFHYEQRIKVRCVATFEDVPVNNGEHILVYTSHESETGTFTTEE